MPQRKHREHEGRSEHDRDRDGERDESGDDPRKHAAILERRWVGSAPPTLERYLHALAQWRALSGAPAPREPKA
jgi:hypothetical protein